MTKNEFIEKAKKSVPFVGTDELWKSQYGKTWEKAKSDYIKECNKRIKAIK